MDVAGASSDQLLQSLEDLGVFSDFIREAMGFSKANVTVSHGSQSSLTEVLSGRYYFKAQHCKIGHNYPKKSLAIQETPYSLFFSMLLHFPAPRKKLASSGSTSVPPLSPISNVPRPSIRKVYGLLMSIFLCRKKSGGWRPVTDLMIFNTLIKLKKFKQ